MKNVFYFILKALFILNCVGIKILFSNSSITNKFKNSMGLVNLVRLENSVFKFNFFY